MQNHFQLFHDIEPNLFRSLNTVYDECSELVKESSSQENISLEAKIDLRQASVDLQTVWIFAVAS